MSDDSEERRTQVETGWYAHPAAKAMYSIFGVSVALTTLVLGIYLPLITYMSRSSEDNLPPSSVSQTAPAERPAEPDTVPELRGDEAGGEPAKSGSDSASAGQGQTEVVAGPRSVAGDEVQVDVTDPGVGNPDVELSKDTDFSQVIQGSTVSLTESLEVPSPVHIVAERVDISENATLSSPRRIWIFANEVEGGTLDVSGSDSKPEGTAEDRGGYDAGSIYVLAKRIDGVNIKAVGGNGAKGKQGHAGRSGRNGNCSGFGGWKAAQRGGSGSDGEQGGRGGDGGDVRVVFADSYQPQIVDNSPGSGGLGGEGGRGGRGGGGCAGLGGVQGPASDGAPGSSGPPGFNGSAGTKSVERKRERVAEILSRLSKMRRSGRTLTPVTLDYMRESEKADVNP